MKISIFSLGIIGLSLVVFGCQKNNTEETQSPAPKQPSVQVADETATKVDELKKKLQQEEDVVSQQSEELAQTQSERDKAALALNLISKTQGSKAEMLEALRENKTVSVLIDIYGSRLSRIHTLENQLSDLNVNPVFYHRTMHERGQKHGQGKVLEEFFISIESLEKFNSFLNDAEALAPEIEVVLVPLKQAILRNYILIDYNQQGILDSDNKVTLLWVGDSAAQDTDAIPQSFTEFKTLWDYTTLCEEFTTGCLGSLYGQDFFKTSTWIDNSMQNPLEFFKQELNKSLNRTITDYFRPEITNLKYVTEFWLVSSDKSTLLDVSNFEDAYGTRAAENKDSSSIMGGAIFQTPLWFGSSIPKATSDPRLNTDIAVRQFHDYLCSVTVCLKRNESHP